MAWYSKFLSIYNAELKTISYSVYKGTRRRVEWRKCDFPLVTVCVIARNEEKTLPACLNALSRQSCRYPFEIIGVDNDSTDHTADIFKLSGIPCYHEPRHGCGYARLCGLMHARGKYHINVDADTLYPPYYVEQMVRELQRPRVLAVGATWSYLPAKGYPRYIMFFYELVRDFYLWLQHFMRPELSVRGLVFAYRTEDAKKAGIRTDIIRGEDGSLALELKKHGKIHFLYGPKTRAFTGLGTLGADGSLLKSIWKRAIKAVIGIPGLFFPKKRYQDKESNLIKNK